MSAEVVPLPRRNEGKEPSLAPILNLTATAMNSVNSIILDRMQSEIPLIPSLAGHLIAGGGKRMRPMLTLAGAELVGYNGTRHHKLAAIAAKTTASGVVTVARTTAKRVASVARTTARHAAIAARTTANAAAGAPAATNGTGPAANRLALSPCGRGLGEGSAAPAAACAAPQRRLAPPTPLPPPRSKSGAPPSPARGEGN